MHSDMGMAAITRFVLPLARFLSLSVLGGWNVSRND
jgi:hypothetical protein